MFNFNKKKEPTKLEKEAKELQESYNCAEWAINQLLNNYNEHKVKLPVLLPRLQLDLPIAEQIEQLRDWEALVKEKCDHSVIYYSFMQHHVRFQAYCPLCEKDVTKEITEKK